MLLLDCKMPFFGLSLIEKLPLEVTRYPKFDLCITSCPSFIFNVYSGCTIGVYVSQLLYKIWPYVSSLSVSSLRSLCAMHKIYYSLYSPGSANFFLL